ncbi:hypothetical protein [Demequina sp.]|nr:hypothetical protein [Demequina sp.]
MRHSTGRRAVRTFGWGAVAVVIAVSLAAGFSTAAAVFYIGGQP